MNVWAVVCDAAGAHEAECVYSLWSTPELAGEEKLRLLFAGIQQPGMSRFSVVEVEIDQPRDEWIG